MSWPRRSGAAIGAFDLTQQQVGELDDLGCLDGVVEVDGAVASRFLYTPMAPANSAGAASCSPPSAPASASGPSALPFWCGWNALRISGTPSMELWRPEASRTAASTAFIAAKHAVS
ncbi:hypothetical protein [Streptomyces sp. PsTaAH-130]|uniref:hypothetical protein n=1 Tax=Streptomyces sp. SID8366 TaxID=2690348 RepID=UPI001EEFAF0B|nr:MULTISPECIES: hypothetical protein [unclassified Streptomyces]